jgi:sulfate adenylyltransferase subunit 1
MLVHTKDMPRVSNNLKVMLVWMDESPMQLGKTYDIKRATSVMPGVFEHINYQVDVNSYKRTEVEKLELNAIASCKMVLTRPIAADKYKENRQTGSFIVVDRVTNNTVGAGMIVDVASREEDKSVKIHREYTEAEVALNRYIRDNFPEWDCKGIS